MNDLVNRKAPGHGESGVGAPAQAGWVNPLAATSGRRTAGSTAPSARVTRRPGTGYAARTLLSLLAIWLVSVAPVHAQLPLPLAQPNLDMRSMAPGAKAVALADGGALVAFEGQTVGGDLQRARLFRLRPDGSVDPGWVVGASGPINDIAVIGDDVYLAGTFFSIFTSSGSVNRQGLARVSLATGAVSSWNPTNGTTTSSEFQSLAVVGDALYVGGRFSQIGATARTHLAKIDRLTGILDPAFNPAVTGAGFARVESVVSDGSALFVGGTFSAINTIGRNNAAKLSLLDGAVVAEWAPIFPNTVNELAHDSGFIYAAGCFATVSGTGRFGLARVAAAGAGALDVTWNPSPNILCIQGVTVDATHVYIGGAFTQVGGLPARMLARVSKSGVGALDSSWGPNLEGATFGKDAQPLGSGSVVLLGSFVTVNGTYSPGIARVSGANGALQAPVIYGERRGTALAFASAPDGGTYVGGEFLNVNGQERRGLFRLTPGGDLDLSWNPGVGFDGGTVRALARDGSHLYVGGDQRARVGSATPDYLSRVSHAGIIDASWNPQASSWIYALLIDEAADSVLAGGFFGSIGGQSRNRAAEVRRTNGLATAFNPDVAGSVASMALIGGDVYLGGSFSSVGGQPRQNVAKVTRGSGAVDPSFIANANSAVSALLPGPAGTLYVAGGFSSISGLGRTGLARLLTSNGLPDPTWNTFPNSRVRALAPASDGFYVAGGFCEIGGQPRRGLARVSHSGVVAPLFAPDLNCDASAVVEQGMRVLAGATFVPVVGEFRFGIAAFPINATPVVPTLTITSVLPQNTQPHQFYRVEVNAVGAGIPLANQRITVDCDSGAFCEMTLDSQGNGACEIASRTPGIRTLTARFAGAAFLLPATDTESHTVAGIAATPPANPAFELRSPGSVLAGDPNASLVRTSDGKLLVAGNFNRIGSEPRRGLARLLPDGNADPAFRADVLPNGSIGALARDASDHVFIVGGFSHINGVFRPRLAKLDPAGNVVPSWVPARTDFATGTAYVDPSGDVIVLGPTSGSGSPTVWRTSLLKFSGVNGEQRFDLDATVSRTTNTPTVRVTGDGTYLYVYGLFESVNGVPRRNLARLSASGVVDPAWDPSPNQWVRDVDPDGAGGVYVAGDFTEIAGQTAQNRLVRLSSTGALVATFNPAPNSTVENVVRDGGSLYVGGFFSSIGGLSRSAQAKIDATTGAADPAFLETFPAGSRFQRLGDALWQPSSFFEMSATDVRYMGAVRKDAATGAVLPTAMVTRPAQVLALARQPDGATLIGGFFARLGSNQRNLVRITPGGFFDTAFSPALVEGRTVRALSVRANGDIYVGDSSGLRKLNAAGNIDPAFASPNGGVFALADAGDGLIAGGSFTQVGSPQVARNRIAKLDYATGAAIGGWNPDASGSVEALAIGPDGAVYLGGAFTTIGGQGRQRLAKLAADGSLDAGWQPQANSTVRALRVEGGDVYAGGFFTTINGTQRRGLAKLAAVGGALANWDPVGTGFSTVYALARAQDGGILVGGSFRAMGGAFRSNAAKLDPTSGIADPLWNPSLDGTVFAILAGYGNTPAQIRLPHVEQNIAIGGEFEFQGAAPMPGFVAVPSVGQPTLPDRMFCDGFEATACVPAP